MDTYVELVEFAQRAEDCHVKLRELQNSKELGLQNLMNPVGSFRQGMARRSRKRLEKSSRKQPQNQRQEVNKKGKETRLKCRHCGGFDHRKSECWKKMGKCLKCGSSNHQIRGCPMLEIKPKLEPKLAFEEKSR